MLKRLTSAALVFSLLVSSQGSWAAAATLNRRAGHEPAPKGADLFAERQDHAAHIVEDAAVEAPPLALDLGPVIAEPDIPEAAPGQPQFESLRGAVAASRDVGEGPSQGPFWTGYFHTAAAPASSDAVDMAGVPSARGLGRATLFSSSLPAVLMAGMPQEAVRIWDQAQALPWWGKLAVAGAAVWGAGKAVRLTVPPVAKRLKWDVPDEQRRTLLAVWGTRAAVGLGFVVAWAGFDAHTAEILSVLTPVLVKKFTDDYVLGTFLLVNHPFYIGEKIRVNVDKEGEKNYIVRGVTWTKMILDDADHPAGDARYYKKIPHSKFIEKSVTIYRPHVAVGVSWIRKLSFSLSPAAAKAGPAAPPSLQKPPMRSVLLWGTASAALVGGSAAGVFLSFPWLAAAAAVSAILPLGFLSSRIVQAVGANRHWEPGAARVLTRILIAGLAILGIHLALGMVGVSATKLMTSLGLGALGLLILTSVALLPLADSLRLKLERDFAVGTKVKLAGEFSGVVHDVIANYVVLRLEPTEKDPEERFQLVPFSQIVTQKQEP